MPVPARHRLVRDHPVKPFPRRLGQQFFRQRNVFLRGKAKTVNDPLLLVLRRFHSLANRHFLFAREQGNLAHLPQIHADGIIQNVQPPLFPFLFLLRFRLFDAVHLGLVHDVDVEVVQFGINLVELRRGDDVVRQGVADVVVGQVSLFLGQQHQFPDFFRQIHP